MASPLHLLFPQPLVESFALRGLDSTLVVPTIAAMLPAGTSALFPPLFSSNKEDDSNTCFLGLTDASMWWCVLHWAWCTVCEEWQLLIVCWSTDAFNICWPPHKGFPSGASGKESAYQCRRRRRHEFNPWVGRIPWRRAWQPTPVFLPWESHGQRSPVGYHPCGHRVGHDWVTERSRPLTKWSCPWTQRWIIHSCPPERPSFPQGSMPNTSPLTGTETSDSVSGHTCDPLPQASTHPVCLTQGITAACPSL